MKGTAKIIDYLFAYKMCLLGVHAVKVDKRLNVRNRIVFANTSTTPTENTKGAQEESIASEFPTAHEKCTTSSIRYTYIHTLEASRRENMGLQNEKICRKSCCALKYRQKIIVIHMAYRNLSQMIKWFSLSSISVSKGKSSSLRL